MSLFLPFRKSPVSELVGPTVPGTPTLTGATDTTLSVAWTPSSDPSGVAGYRLYIAVAPGTPVRVSGLNVDTVACAYTFAGLADGVSYNIQVTAVDVYGNESARSATFTNITAATFSWQDQAPSGVTAIPYLDGFGATSYGGSGRDGSAGRVTVFFLDDLGSGTVDAAYTHASYPGGLVRMRHGSVEGFKGVAEPKILVANKSGTVNLGADWRPGSYTDVYGQFAPGGGLIFRGTSVLYIKTYSPTGQAQHLRLWHLDIRPGDDAAGITPADRDGMDVGHPDGSSRPTVSNVMYNCAVRWTTDEIIAGINGVDGFSIAYCDFSEALHRSIHDDGGGPDEHGFGPLFGSEYAFDRLDMQRNLFAHNSYRNPYVVAEKFAFSNNLIFNAGQPNNTTGACIELAPPQAGTANTQQHNIVRNLLVKGINMQVGVHRFVEGIDGGPPAGSTGFLSGNGAHGYTLASQDDARVGAFPSGYSQATLRSAAWPSGWGSSLEGTLALGSNPLALTTAEKAAFAELVTSTCGPLPGFSRSWNRTAVIGTQIQAAISGSGDQGSIVNSVAGTSNPSGWPNTALRFSPNAGGWPVPTTVTVDPFSPGSYWHAPIPMNGNAPDDRVVASHTLRNGKVSVNRTALENWALDQHLYVGGHI